MTDRKTGPLTPDEEATLRRVIDKGAPTERERVEHELCVETAQRLFATLDAEREAHARTVAEQAAAFDALQAAVREHEEAMLHGPMEPPDHSPIMELDRRMWRLAKQANLGADTLRAYVERETAANYVKRSEVDALLTALGEWHRILDEYGAPKDPDADALANPVKRLAAMTKAMVEERDTLRAELARVEAERDVVDSRRGAGVHGDLP